MSTRAEKRWLVPIVLHVVLLSLVGYAADDVDPYAADDRNLLSDPGFEDWELGAWTQYGCPAGCTCGIATDTTHTDSTSFKALFYDPEADNNFHHVKQTVSARPLTTYKITYWARTEDMSHATGIACVMRQADGSEIDEGGSYPGHRNFSLTPTGTNDWQLYTTYLTTTHDTGQIVFQLRAVVHYDVTGTVWWDDLALKPVPEIRSVAFTDLGASLGVNLVGASFGTDPDDRSTWLNNVKVDGEQQPAANVVSWNDAQIRLNLPGVSPSEAENMGFQVTSGAIKSNTAWEEPILLLSNDAIELTFDKSNGFAVTQIRNVATDRLFLSDEASPAYLYAVEYPNGEASSRAADLITYSVDEPSRTLTVIFHHTDLSVVATATIQVADQAPRASWSLTMANSSDLIIRSVRYPYLLGRTPLGDAPEDDALILPYQEGALYKDPYAFARGMYMCKDYPGCMNMQFMAYYDSEELPNGTGRGGLYISSLDAQGYKKNLGFEPVTGMTENYITLSYEHVRSELPGQDFDLDYAMVIRLFEGDWHDAADLYKTWALEQSWAELTVPQRTDIPEEIIDIDKMIATYSTEIEDYTQFVRGYRDRYATEPHEFADPRLLLYPGGYWSIRDNGARPKWSGIDYFEPLPDGTIPMDPPVGDLLTSKIQELRDINTGIYFFLSGLRWELYEEIDATGELVFDDRDDFYDHGEDYVVRKADGADDYPVYAGTFVAPEGHTRYCASMCVGTDEDNIMDMVVVDNVERGVRRGARAMSLDQVVGARIKGCWNPLHGHPLGQGTWTQVRFADLLERVNNRVASLGKSGQFAFSMENQHELVIPYLQFQYGRHGFYQNWPAQKKIPLFNYVYHGRYIGVDNSYGIHGNIQARWARGNVFVQANIPGFMAAAEEDPFVFDFSKKLMLHATKILRRSSILNPPTIEGLPPDEIVLYTSGSRDYEFHADVIPHNVFRRPDDKIHYLFVNIHAVGEPAHSLSFDLSPYDLDGSYFDVYQVVNGQPSLLFDQTTLPRQVAFVIGGEDIVEFIVVPHGAMLNPGEASSLLVTGYDTVSGDVEVSFTQTCETNDHVAFSGPLETVSTLAWDAASCGLGTSGSARFNPGAGSRFFVIVGQGDISEGSYGRDGDAAERSEATGLGSCDLPQDLQNSCL